MDASQVANPDIYQGAGATIHQDGSNGQADKQSSDEMYDK